MFSVDGTRWDLPCDITRVAEMKSSDISGLMLDMSYFNDVLGTFMKYDIKIVVPFGYEMDYNALYEILTQPVDGHAFVLPYDGGMIAVTGRVESVRDMYAKASDGTIHWRGISFTVTANHPSKQMTLNEVIARGLSPMPDASIVDVGSAYIYTVSGWEEIQNGEDIYY